MVIKMLLYHIWCVHIVSIEVNSPKWIGYIHAAINAIKLIISIEFFLRSYSIVAMVMHYIRRIY